MCANEGIRSPSDMTGKKECSGGEKKSSCVCTEKPTVSHKRRMAGWPHLIGSSAETGRE